MTRVRGAQRTLMLVAAVLFGIFLVVAFVFRRLDASQETLSIVAGAFAYVFLVAAGVVLVRAWRRGGRGPLAAATRFVSRHPAVADAVGAPVRVGELEGEVPPGGPTAAQANLAVPVSGPEGEARVDLVMARVAREWEVLSGTLVAGGKRVSLAEGISENALGDRDGEG